MSNSEDKTPNVKFIGKKRIWDSEKKALVSVTREVPAYVMNVREKIDLPEGVQAEKPFYSEFAETLCLISKDFLPVNSPTQPTTDLPETFPMREILRGENLQLADVVQLDREALLKIPGIGEKSADKIIQFLEENKQNAE
jgi:hypothetical protein